MNELMHLALSDWPEQARRGVNALHVVVTLLNPEGLGLPQAAADALVNVLRMRGHVRAAARLERLAWLSEPAAKAAQAVFDMRG